MDPILGSHGIAVEQYHQVTTRDTEAAVGGFRVPQGMVISIKFAVSRGLNSGFKECGGWGGRTVVYEDQLVPVLVARLQHRVDALFDVGERIVHANDDVYGSLTLPRDTPRFDLGIGLPGVGINHRRLKPFKEGCARACSAIVWNEGEVVVMANVARPIDEGMPVQPRFGQGIVKAQLVAATVTIYFAPPIVQKCRYFGIGHVKYQKTTFDEVGMMKVLVPVLVELCCDRILIVLVETNACFAFFIDRFASRVRNSSNGC